MAELSARGGVAGRFRCWAEPGPRGRGFVCVWLARDNLPVTVEQEVFARQEKSFFSVYLSSGDEYFCKSIAICSNIFSKKAF